MKTSFTKPLSIIRFLSLTIIFATLFNFTSKAQCTITGLKFTDSNGGTPTTITNGGTYSINSLPSTFTVEASVSGTVNSVRFTVSGNTSYTHVENSAPWNTPATGGAFTYGAGSYTVVVRSYSGADASGTNCSTETYNFTLTNSTCDCTNSASNILVNPSFEQNGASSTTGWAHSGQGNLSAGNGFVVCGSFNGFNNNPNGNGESMVYQDVTNNISAGLNMTFSGYAATHEPNAAPKLVMIFYGSASGTGGELARFTTDITKDVDTDGKLALYSITKTAPTGTVRVRVGTTINYDYVKMDAYCLKLNCTKPVIIVGTITGPTCTVATGSVSLSGLPSSGTWSLERSGTSSATTTGTGATTTVSGLAPGNYTFKVTSSLGCISNATATVTIPGTPAAPTLSTAVTNTSCNGGNNGAINLTVTGGLSPYSYNWGNGQPTTQDRTGLTAGTYNVTVTDANSCTKTTSATVTQPAVIVLSETHVNAVCNGGNTGSINLTVSGGATAYTYNWGNGQPTTQDRTGLTAGTYNVTVTDGNGCTKTTSVVITEPTAISIQESHVNLSCSGAQTGSIDLTVSGGTPTYTYNWGAGQPTTEDRTNLSAGTYNVTVTDSKGCTKTASITITEPAPGSIGNYTYIDANGNGIQDGGESHLNGVTVKLYNANANGTPNGAAIATAVTANGGLYNFPNICAGNYVIEFGTVATYNRTIQQNNASKDATDSDANPTTGFTGLITIAQGENDMSNDAGYYVPASISDRVWVDENKSGFQDAGDTNLSGVTVTLLDESGNVVTQDGSGNSIVPIVTDANGYYIFSNLRPGTYKVRFGEANGYTRVAKNQGAAELDSDADTNTGVTANYTLQGGDKNTTVDAGFQKSAPLSVNLLKFEAKIIENNTVLNWKTADEKDFSHFEIQKSTNAKEFGEIGSLNGIGANFYSYSDNNTEKGINYYRLKMVNTDGTFEYSKMVSVNFDGSEVSTSVQNPAINGEFTVITNMYQPTFILKSAMATNVETRINKIDSNKFVIQVPNYNPGMYFLIVADSDGKFIAKKVILK